MKRSIQLSPLQKYVIGFGLSLILTVLAYFLTQKHVASNHLTPSDRVTVTTLLVLAVSQMVTQLVFFLHLGQEAKPRWKLTMALGAVMVVFILVMGSLWIMWNLNYHMAPIPSDQQIIHDELNHG